ncbi:GNAT family N-acetyltransferase [Phenylobacterium sp.]|uniref:GNAT family N-acetyltransferase n=1 Tax=Phenylobacterium sp. TaxID=1871053 RepID=UPI00198D4D51|nr:GNAT family N-acetyltransferase [Phenylobacterium sp.]MBC7169231.1 N-acetyltransferase [Phenylobacterium sp.]
MIVRPAESRDMPALAAIYGHHVLHGFGTFEEVPPSADELEARRQAVVARGLPYLLAEEAGRVLGFAYAGPFRPRAAYRYTVEDSVYIAPDMQGRGVGKAVLSAVLAACESLGIRQVVAVIGDSGNQGSIGLHKALGFTHQGVGEGFGYKHGRWVDIVWMQKALNGGTGREPDAPGLVLSGV